MMLALVTPPTNISLLTFTIYFLSIQSPIPHSSFTFPILIISKLNAKLLIIPVRYMVLVEKLYIQKSYNSCFVRWLLIR